MDSDDDGFPKQGGEALDIGEDFDSDEDEAPAKAPAAQKKASPKRPQGPPVQGEKVENQPFDLAVDVDDSEEVESDEEEDEVNVDVDVKHSATAQQKVAAGTKVAPVQATAADEADPDDDEKEVEGAYNPA